VRAHGVLCRLFVTRVALATLLDMTNKLSVLAMLAAIACSTTSTPPPEKVYDFSARPLTGVIPAPSSARSPKAQIRRALDQLQPQLAACTKGTAGELAISLRVELSPDEPAALAGVDVAYPDANAATCARDALAAIDVSLIDMRESALLVVHAPFIVAASK